MILKRRTVEKYVLDPFSIIMILIFLPLFYCFCGPSCGSNTVPLAQTYPISVPPSVLGLPSISNTGIPSPSTSRCGGFGSYSPTMAYSSVSILQLVINTIYFVLITLPKRIIWRTYKFSQRNFLLTFSIVLIISYFMYRNPSSYQGCEKIISSSVDSCGELIKKTCSAASSSWNRFIDHIVGTCEPHYKQGHRASRHYCHHRKHRHHEQKLCIQERFKQIEKDIALDEQDKKASEAKHHFRRMKLLKELRELLERSKQTKIKDKHCSCFKKVQSWKKFGPTAKRYRKIRLSGKSKCKTPFFLRRLCKGPLFKPKLKPHTGDIIPIHNIPENSTIPVPESQNIVPTNKGLSCNCHKSENFRTIEKVLKPIQKPIHKKKCFCRWVRRSGKDIRNFQVPIHGDAQMFKSDGNSLFGIFPKRQFHHCKCKRFIISKQNTERPISYKGSVVRKSITKTYGENSTLNSAMITGTRPTILPGDTASDTINPLPSKARQSYTSEKQKKTFVGYDTKSSNISVPSIQNSVRVTSATPEAVTSVSSSSTSSIHNTQSNSHRSPGSIQVLNSRPSVSITPAISGMQISNNRKSGAKNATKTRRSVRTVSTGYGASIKSEIPTNTSSSTMQSNSSAISMVETRYVPSKITTSKTQKRATVQPRSKNNITRKKRDRSTKRTKVKTIAASRSQPLPNLPPTTEAFHPLNLKDSIKNVLVKADHDQVKTTQQKNVRVCKDEEMIRPSHPSGIISDLLGGSTVETTGDDGGCISIGGLGGYDGIANTEVLPATVPFIPEVTNPIPQTFQLPSLVSNGMFPTLYDQGMTMPMDCSPLYPSIGQEAISMYNGGPSQVMPPYGFF